MNILTNTLSLFFVLGVLIVLHEGGHFAVAKFFKFPVEVFSVGFGKRLFGFKRKETDYRVSLVPLGGYVKIVGLGPDESDVVEGKEPVQRLTGTRFQRLLIFFAGPGVNLVLALLLTAWALSLGVETPKHYLDKPLVSHLDANSPALAAGVHVGDLITKVNGRPVTTWREVEEDLGIAPRALIPVEVKRGEETLTLTVQPRPETQWDIGYTGLNAYLPAVVGGLSNGYPGQKAGLQLGDRIVSIAGHPVGGYYDIVRQVRAATEAAGGKPQPIAFVVERAGKTLDFSITPQKQGSSFLIGIRPQFEFVRVPLSFGESISAAWKENIRQTVNTFQTIKRLFTGSGSIKQFSGPIDIAGAAGNRARTGFADLLQFMGLLSLQLGLLNLLPIPILDGGHILVILIESVVRRDLPLVVKERLLQAGFLFLVGLMGTVLFFDFWKNLQ